MLSERLFFGQGDTPIVHCDLVLLHQMPGTTLETLFAHLGQLLYLFRRAGVAYRESTSVRMQQLYKTIGHMFDFVVPLSLEVDIDPMVFGNADDIPFQPVADLDGLEDLVVVDHAPVPVVDRDAESDRGLGYNQDIDLLAGRNGDLRIVDKTLQVCRGNDPTRYPVFIDIYRILFTDLQTIHLVAVREKKVFGFETPVEECTVNRFVHHLQVGDFADGGQRMFGGGDQAVLGVVVDENLDRVADLVLQRGVSVGKKYFGPLLVGEV